MFHKKICIHNGPNYQTHEENITIYVDLKMLAIMGVDKVEVYWSTYLDIS
jgi:hypothetical protein